MPDSSLGRYAALAMVPTVVGAIPGLTIFLDWVQSPPESRGVLTVGLEIVALLSVGLLMLHQDQVVSWTRTRAARAALLGGGLAVTAFLGYWALLDTALKEHFYYGPTRPDTIVVALLPDQWADATLGRYVACARAQFLRCDTVTAVRSYSAEDVAAVAGRYGPGVVQEQIPAWATRATIIAMFLSAALCVVGLVRAFGVIALRVGAHGAATPASASQGTS